MKVFVVFCLVQIVQVISAPTYIIESYSKVRIQRPTIGLSVESEMPMEMLNNPVLADEQPPATNKMDSIFIKENKVKNIKSMNIDEKSIMESINGPTASEPQQGQAEFEDDLQMVEDIRDAFSINDWLQQTMKRNGPDEFAV